MEYWVTGTFIFGHHSYLHGHSFPEQETINEVYNLLLHLWHIICIYCFTAVQATTLDYNFILQSNRGWGDIYSQG